MITSNRVILKSEKITQSTKKFIKKFNLNNLNLSLTNKIENSSFIILKDGTIKKKRHKNSYLEEYLENKRLLMTLEATAKIRRTKSYSNDNRKKNLFYKTNYWYFKKNDKRNSDNNILEKVQRINMLENAFINDKLKEELNDINNKETLYRFSHNNYRNKLNLSNSHNDWKSGRKKNKSNKKKKISNSNNNNKCDYKKGKDDNKFENLKKSKYKNLGKFLNKKEIKLNKNRNKDPIEFNDFKFAFKNTVKNNEYNENKNKFDVTFKNVSKDDNKNNNIDGKEKKNNNKDKNLIVVLEKKKLEDEIVKMKYS